MGDFNEVFATDVEGKKLQTLADWKTWWIFGIPPFRWQSVLEDAND
jgi:hypothetical protein